jgi:hypothetical protein
LKTEAAAKLNGQATESFEQGNQARERSDEYVRATVTLATVLLLIAIGQRFKAGGARIAMLGVTLLLLCFPIWHLFRLPRG